MTFEIAVSTMHKKRDQIIDMLKDEKIFCNCMVINQCDESYYEEIKQGTQIIKIFYTTERGLSRSRNIALLNASTDILAFADDDLEYYTDFDKKIIAYYEKNPLADIVLFNMDDWEHTYPSYEFKCKFLKLSSFTSMQITLKPNNVSTRFNVLFGSGSKLFDSGEENVFLADCFRKKNKIFYCPEKILRRNKAESTWFKGYSDKKYVSDRGAVYYAISKFYYLPYVIRFAFSKRKKIKPITPLAAVFLMRLGKQTLKKLSK